jgi:HEAT repeat protein
VEGRVSSSSLAIWGEGVDDPFVQFVDYALDLQVQDWVEKRGAEPTELSGRSEWGPESPKIESPKIETYGVLDGILRYGADHVLLVGKPGSGKTTALERLLVERDLIEQKFGGKVPVLLRLRDLDPQAKQPVLERLQHELARRDLCLRLGLEQLQGLLDQGQFLLLLDGVNELPDPGLRRRVQDFRERYRFRTPMIFTTRPLNVGVDLGIAKKLEMKPLSSEQMGEFVQRHLGVERGEVLLGQLGERLREFGETPLLLWMICGLFSKTGEIPANLGLAFRKFVSIYEDQKQLAEERFWQSRFLQALAFAMMPQGGNPFGLRLQMSRQEAEALLARVLGIPILEASKRLTVLLRYHLLQVKDGDELEFKHQLFQEYYAAEYLLGRLGELSELALQKYYLNLLDWSEAVALVAGLVKTEGEAVRLVRLGLEVDLYWGARLAGEVPYRFQEATVQLVIILSIPVMYWVEFFRERPSKQAIPMIIYVLGAKKSPLSPPLWAELLGRTKSAAAIPMLTKALEVYDWEVCQAAAQALYQVQGRVAIQAFAKVFESSSPGVRANLAQALGEIPDGDIIPFLLNALKDEHWAVRRAAAQSLDFPWFEPDETVILVLLKALLDDDWEVQMSASETLNRIVFEFQMPELLQHTVIVQELLTIWNNGHPYCIDSCIARFLAVVNNDHMTIPALLRVVKDKNQDLALRCEAVEALGMIGNEIIMPNLLEILEDQDVLPDRGWNIRRNAIEALSNFENDLAIQCLVTAIEDQDYSVRWYATAILSSIQHEKSIPGLIKALDHPELYVRWNAAKILSKFQQEAAITGLNQAVDDQGSIVNWSIRAVLGKQFGEIAIPDLCKALEVGNREIRSDAIGILGDIRTETAIEILLELLENGSKDLDRRIIERLADIESDLIVPALITALEHEDSYIRQKSVETLGKLKDEVAIPGLFESLQDKENSVREQAVQALGEFHHQPIILEKLFSMLNDEHQSVREKVVQVLAGYSGEVVVPKLLKVLETEKSSYIRSKIAEVLSKYQGEVSMSYVWQDYQQNPYYLLKEMVPSLQNRYKLYNYEISQIILPEDQASSPTTSPAVNYDLRGAHIGNLANTVHGHQQTQLNPTQEPQP